MKFNTFPWGSLSDCLTYQLGVEAHLIDCWLRKEGFSVPNTSYKRYIVPLEFGKITFAESMAFFEGTFPEEELLKWEAKFKSWSINYSDKIDFLINEYSELDNEIFFNSYPFDADIFLSEVLDYLPALENKGIIFDFRNTHELSDPTKFVLEDADSVIRIISLEQRSKEKNCDHIVSELILKTELPEARNWLLTIYLGHILTNSHNENEISHILDYFNSPDVDASQIGLTSYVEMNKRVNKWIEDFNKKLTTKVGFENKDHKTVFISKEGYSLLKLLSSDAKKMEGKEMNNCIGRLHLNNENLYSVRLGTERIASMDIRLGENNKYYSQEIKGYNNQSVLQDHWTGIRSCLLEYFNLDFKKSNDLSNIGWRSYPISSDVSVVLESNLNIPSNLFSIQYFTKEEVEIRKNAILEQISEDKIRKIVESQLIKAAEEMSTCPYTNTYITKNEAQQLKDFETDFTETEILKLAQAAYGPLTERKYSRCFITDRDLDNVLGVKRARTTFLEEVFVGLFPSDFNLPKVEKPYYYLEPDINATKTLITNNLKGKNKSLINKIEEHTKNYLPKLFKCPYTKVYLPQKEYELVFQLYNLELKDKELFSTVALNSTEGSFTVLLENIYLTSHQSFNFHSSIIEKNINIYLNYSFNKDLRNIKKDQSLSEEQRKVKEYTIRQFVFDISKLYKLEAHPSFFEFLTFKDNDEYFYTRFSNPSDVVTFLLPTYNPLKEILGRIKYYKSDLPSYMDSQDGIRSPEDPGKCDYCDNVKLFDQQYEIYESIERKLSEINDEIDSYNEYIGIISREIDYLEELLQPLHSTVYKIFTKQINVVNQTYSQPDLEELKEILFQFSKLTTVFQDSGTSLILKSEELNNALDHVNSSAENINDLAKDIENLLSDLHDISGESCPGDEEGENSCIGEEIIDANAKLSQRIESCELNPKRNNLEEITDLRECLANLFESFDAKELIRELLSRWKSLIK